MDNKYLFHWLAILYLSLFIFAILIAYSGGMMNIFNSVYLLGFLISGVMLIITILFVIIMMYCHDNHCQCYHHRVHNKKENTKKTKKAQIAPITTTDKVRVHISQNNTKSIIKNANIPITTVTPIKNTWLNTNTKLKRSIIHNNEMPVNIIDTETTNIHVPIVTKHDLFNTCNNKDSETSITTRINTCNKLESNINTDISNLTNNNNTLMDDWCNIDLGTDQFINPNTPTTNSRSNIKSEKYKVKYHNDDSFVTLMI